MNPPPPSRRKRSRAAAGVGTILAVILLVVVAAVTVVAVTVVGELGRGGGGGAVGDGLVPADVAEGTPVAQAPALDPVADVEAWAAETSERTDVPVRALAAYARAELVQREEQPECGLSWNTLAGIGRVESQHGAINGSEVDADGVARPPIIGIPLDGSNDTREILDTEAGRLDEDTTYDRAVGPMQFLPTTWEVFGADGNADGRRDPQQIDDAALAAARYLCADGRDTATGAGWWSGVLTYNSSGEYARLVWAAADRYAAALSTAS